MRFTPHLLVYFIAFFSFGSIFSNASSAIENFGTQNLENGQFADKSLRENTVVKYEVTFHLQPNIPSIKKSLQDMSSMFSKQKTGVSSVPVLLGLARTDKERLAAVLYSEGYYGGLIDIRFNGQPVEEFTFNGDTSANNLPLAVSVRIEPGSLFYFGKISIKQPSSEKLPFSYNPGSVGLISGQPAKSTIVIDAAKDLVAKWRHNGYPHARLVSTEVVADHATRELNIVLNIDTGHKAVFGIVTVVGTDKLDAGVVLEQTAIEVGSEYTPTTLDIARTRLRKIEGIESIRIREGEAVDETGAIPIFVEVTERKPRFVGATTSWSNVDGAEVQAYWGHRNIFGRGELLRFDGSISEIGSNSVEDLEYSLRATLLKPGLLDIDTDLLTEIWVFRERPDTYDSWNAKAKIGIAHRFNNSLSGSIALSGDRSRIEDAFDITNYWLLGLPGDVIYDNRDKRLDPTSGFRSTVKVAPYFDLENDENFLLSQASIAGYQIFESDKRVVFAGRLAIGSIVGAKLNDIPETYRFYSGGGGSVRGYPYRSIGPSINGVVVGGRSFFEVSGEIRLRVSRTIGIVPFVDMGNVSEGEFFNSKQVTRVGAGIGLRYYTALGPLRFDVAVPVEPEPGDPKIAFYVGLGQAF